MKSFPYSAPPDEPTPHRVDPLRSRRPERQAELVTILVVGPRDLSGKQMVEVWMDAGSGWAGQRVTVPAKRLTLSRHDRGEGVTALYEYEPHHCQG